MQQMPRHFLVLESSSSSVLGGAKLLHNYLSRLGRESEDVLFTFDIAIEKSTLHSELAKV